MTDPERAAEMGEALSGRALDRAVHEQVFGREYVEQNSYGGMRASNVPPYSMDIREAWKIVEHFAGQHTPVSLYSMAHGIYFCFFGRPPILDPANPFKLTHEARANTPSEAICRAALRALQGDGS